MEQGEGGETCSAASGSTSMPDYDVNVKITNAGGTISHETLVGACTQAVVRDDRAFLGEPLHVCSLLPEKRQRDKQREVPNEAKCKQCDAYKDAGKHMLECPIARSRASSEARMLSHSAHALGLKM